MRTVSIILLALGLWLVPAARAADCPGDASGDGAVDVADLVQVILAWGTADPAADVNDDGLVDVADLVDVITNWGDCLEAGTWPAHWISGGPACGLEPAIQAHAYNDDFHVLRQSLCTNFEAPFMFLIFGSDTVLMLDSGAGGISIAAAVDSIIDGWLAARGQASIDLLVAHTHGHGDHVAGDSQLAALPYATVVGPQLSAVIAEFGFTDWPNDIVELDLGGRILDVIPIPGHQSAHIAVYDRQTGLLVTGDTLYPGRLYISSFNQYVDSIQRLVDFTATRPVCAVLGTHIEMTNTPGDDYGFGVTHHPDEHPLPLGREHLLELLEGVQGMQANPVIEVHDDFIIWPF